MNRNVLSYLDAIVKQEPDKVAFSGETEVCTFRQAYRQSRAVGTFLHKKGLYRKPVVVFMERTPKTIAAFLGVIAAGCFYVPVDREMPVSRIERILENCQPECMICEESVLEKVKAVSFSGEVCLYDAMAQTKEDANALHEIRKRAVDADLVYISYHSDSSGAPKGVAACHRLVLDYTEQLSELLSFHRHTIFASQIPFCSDAGLHAVYPALKAGATTYLVPDGLLLFPIKLVEFLNACQINTICWDVSVLTMISAFGTFQTVKPERLKTIASISEAFPAKQYKIWKEALPEASFISLYGPIEGMGMCCYASALREKRGNGSMPIGKPFPNTEILLLDAKDRPAAEGEICIRGASVAPGYYNNPKQTAEAFVQNPMQPAYSEMIYRTGDVGRYNAYGELVLVAGTRDQIHHMGHRIESGEIERCVGALKEIRMCCCMFEKEKGRIALYYVGRITERRLAAKLVKTLPRYMMPHHIAQLHKMPLAEDGTIDRALLQEKVAAKKR